MSIEGALALDRDGERPVRTLVPGDRVRTPQGPRTVRAVCLDATPREWIGINGGMPRWSADEPVHTHRGWVEARGIGPGDRLRGPHEEEVRTVERTRGARCAVRVEVQGARSWYAGDVEVRSAALRASIERTLGCW